MLPASLSARWLDREYVECTQTGGLMTVVAYAVMLVLFTCELWSFLDFSMSSSLELAHREGPQLQINFDVDLHNIDCKHLEVGVIDELGQSPIRSLEKDYDLNTIDKNGRLIRRFSSKTGADVEEDEDTKHQKTVERLKKEDGQKELDSDWATSHDGFKHKSFEHVLQSHDFTLINFFAEWCVHCRQFAPTWNQIADEVKRKQYTDKDGKTRQVVPIKMNCVDFGRLCRNNGIDAFPTIRLYKADGSFSRFEGHRSLADVVRWTEHIVHKLGYSMQKDQETPPGCNAKGFLRVPRVPGYLEFAAGNGDQDLDPTATNVSHLVKHLSFSDPRDGIRTQKAWPSLPRDALRHVAPLDGRQFCTQAFHEAYEHHLRVVSTVTSAGVSYQYTHYGRTAQINTSLVPQARFQFDLEPFTIMVQREIKPWYDFGTSLLAILGGIFVLMRLLTMVSLAASKAASRWGPTPARVGADTITGGG